MWNVSEIDNAISLPWDFVNANASSAVALAMAKVCHSSKKSWMAPGPCWYHSIGDWVLLKIRSKKNGSPLTDAAFILKLLEPRHDEDVPERLNVLVLKLWLAYVSWRLASMVCVHGVQGMHSSNHCKHWPMLGHCHRKRLDALPLILSKSYRRNANPFNCRRPRLARVRNTRIRFDDSSQTCIKFRLFRIVRFVLTFSFDFFFVSKTSKRRKYRPTLRTFSSTWNGWNMMVPKNHKIERALFTLNWRSHVNMRL